MVKIMFLSAAEAAELLGISPQRMRDLLQKNRVQGARKIYRVWVVPVFEDGLPRISSGKRGPIATWKKKVRRPAAMNQIHVNRQNLDKNRKNKNNDKTVFSVKRSGKNVATGYTAEINGPCKLVYSPDKPLSCGAIVWIETPASVTVYGLDTVKTVSSR